MYYDFMIYSKNVYEFQFCQLYSSTDAVELEKNGLEKCSIDLKLRLIKVSSFFLISIIEFHSKHYYQNICKPFNDIIIFKLNINI